MRGLGPAHRHHHRLRLTAVRKRPFLLALAAVLIAAALAAAATASTIGSELMKALETPGISPAKTAALAVDLSTGAVVFAHNETLPVIPASNEKLPLSWAALKRLGPGYRFHTEVYGIGAREGATWRGDLVLKGFGDPTLSSADIEGLAAKVRASGIHAVTGRVLGDESFYDRDRGAPGWKQYFLGGETPPLSALVVDRALGWPALSPPLLAARDLRGALGMHGISVGGRPGLGAAPPDAASLASDVSAPLGVIVHTMNHASDNFYAEMLLKQLAAADGKVGSSAAGGRIVIATMKESGIPVAGVRIVDGSGLSSLDRVTAEALVGVLLDGATDPTIRKVFVSSLAVAGHSGTLSRRLWGLKMTVRGKTGTTDIACTLSGLIGKRYAFAVLENGNPVPSWSARSAQDRFVTILAQAP
jgi:D-alanyl-D-alanine carboxypeptidase/D-alanyl-D-alanine-endopeptidase (penicillin-binding protein 4)